MQDLEQLTKICHYLAAKPNRFATISQLRLNFPDCQIYEILSKERHQLLEKHKVILLLWASYKHPKLNHTLHGWQLVKDWQKSLELIAKSPQSGDMVLGGFLPSPKSGDMVLSPNQIMLSQPLSFLPIQAILHRLP